MQSARFQFKSNQLFIKQKATIGQLFSYFLSVITGTSYSNIETNFFHCWRIHKATIVVVNLACQAQKRRRGEKNGEKSKIPRGTQQSFIWGGSAPRSTLSPFLP